MIEDKIWEKIKKLPINCRICGDRLSLGGTYPSYVAWSCDYKDVYSKMKPDRSIADKHYSDSTMYLEFDEFKHYEHIENILKDLLI